MRERLEEDPDPDDEQEAAAAPAPGTLAPLADGVREFEYRTDVLTGAEVVDGTTLSGQLSKASADGWDLVDIVSAGDRHAIVLRRVKRPERRPRPVGFTPQKL